MATSSMLGTQINISKNCILSNDEFIILGDYENSKEFAVDLAKGKVGTIGNLELRTRNHLPNPIRITYGTIVWGMCNMINNAIHQWTGITPFLGKDVREDLSLQASAELAPYGLSLKLTDNNL